jgi:protein SCO1/2
LTFVYTQCTDICPLIAHKLSQVYSALGSDANRVKFVAISTAPETDTPISIEKFSQEQGMMGKWTFLSGSRAQLEPVWKNYFIDVASGTGSDQSVLHQSRVIVIDPEGNERVNYPPDLKPEDLVYDLKILLTQG